MLRSITMNTRHVDEPQKIEIIELKGSLDNITVEQIKEPIKELIFAQKINNLIINCDNLDYINSIGLAYLVYQHMRLKEQKGSLKFVAKKNTSIYEVIDISGIINFVDVYNNIEEALDSLKSEKKM